MENNEIIMNEMEDGIVEVAEETVADNSGKGLMIAAGIGVAAIVGIVIYKKLIKPAIAKAKTKKEAEEVIEADFDEVEENDEEVDS